MRIYEIGTGYTSIPANKGAATEIVVENLSRALIARGHEVTVVDIADARRLPTDLPILEVPMPKGFSGTDEALGVRHKLKRVVYGLRLAKVLKSVLRAVPDSERVVLHFHNQYNLYFFLKTGGGAYRDRCLIAYTCHSYVWHDPWNKIEQTVRKRYFQEVYCVQKADLVYVLNERTKATVVEHLGVDPGRVVVIVNGVDTDAYQPLADEEKRGLRRELGLEGKVAVIQVGSVCDRKNQAGALELLLPVMKEDPRVCYLYAGGVIDEDYKAGLDRLAEENGVEGKVIYLGELAPGAELNRYYNLAEALLFPTKAEAFSLVIIEAMSSGISAFISDSLDVDIPNAIRFKDASDFKQKFNELVLSAAAGQDAAALHEGVAGRFLWGSVAAHYAREIQARLDAKGAC
ncbi:MAG: glycosyltransferase family 4 protein [Coriobacteriia bacterium]